MRFNVAANALKDNQKWFRNAFTCLFPECQLKACVCGWHLGACWSMLGERALSEVRLCVCLWLPGCHRWGTVTSPAITNVAACKTAALHVRQCRKNQQSFSKPPHKHPSHPGGPAEESGTQRVQGIPGKIWGMFWACLLCWQTLMCPLSFPLLF